MHIKYTYIDAKTKVPATIAPMRYGPIVPDVAGLTFGFAEESRYPTEAPTFYGTCPDESNINKPGVLSTLTEAEYLQANAEELDRRKTIARRNIDGTRDQHIFRDSIPYTFPGDTEPDGVQLRDERDRQNIQDNMIDAGIIKGLDETMYFMPTSNQPKAMTPVQMLDMGAFLKARGDAIYAAAWAIKAQVAVTTTLEELRAIDLNAGWPEDQ